MGFDMMALMNDKSKAQAAGAGKYELQKIPIDKMIPNPANDKLYEVGEIDELAQSILLTGKVLQNAVVAPADENGNHIIIAGHRRRLACQKLVEDGHSEFGEIPCVVLGEQDNLMQELFLIQTNSTARVLSDAEKVRQAERATAILTELKDRKQISGRVRDIAAKMLGTTKSQLARYNVISKGLTNETLKESFEKGEMGVSAAYEAARMDEAGQEKLAAKVDAGENVSVKDVVEQRENRQTDAPAEETDKNTHQEPVDNTDDEIEELREKWFRERAIDKVIKELRSTMEYSITNSRTEAEQGHNNRARVQRLKAEIIREYVFMAIKEKEELEKELGDWKDLFYQEAHA
ncbi:MAG: hypothetical protein E7201_02685 [Selenomonas ruminantium]|uniref:ParB-like N-terminal domain-containing protein n=1 Tax=Selenomonas ruminantium TaxID=971 RepID=A0A927ZQQ9_SELRU|nr:hypothetical protein [Selenomonas ruminantium]